MEEAHLMGVVSTARGTSVAQAPEQGSRLSECWGRGSKFPMMQNRSFFLLFSLFGATCSWFSLGHFQPSAARGDGPLPRKSRGG